MKTVRQVLFATTLLMLGPGLACATMLTGDAAFSAGDYVAAHREWSQAVGNGDASAMAALGTLYDTGHGVPQDFAQALAWYRQAAEAGSVRGMFNTGAMYDNGRGTPVNRVEALRWYARAAERGHGRAAFDAGLIYRDGDGVPRDRAAAIHYFRIAAQNGVEAAWTNLVALHATEPPQSPMTNPTLPRPRPRPPSPALDADQLTIARLQKAILTRGPLDSAAIRDLSEVAPTLLIQAGKDSRIAQYDIGFAFENGYGVTRDPVRSYVYYLRAAASPEPGVKTAALRGAADVAKTLTDVQHGAARDMLLDGAP